MDFLVDNFAEMLFYVLAAQLSGHPRVLLAELVQVGGYAVTTDWLLRDLDAQLEIARRTEKTRADALDIITARFDKGTVPRLDVDQAEIELAGNVNLATIMDQVEPWLPPRPDDAPPLPVLTGTLDLDLQANTEIERDEIIDDLKEPGDGNLFTQQVK